MSEQTLQVIKVQGCLGALIGGVSITDYLFCQSNTGPEILAINYCFRLKCYCKSWCLQFCKWWWLLGCQEDWHLKPWIPTNICRITKICWIHFSATQPLFIAFKLLGPIKKWSWRWKRYNPWPWRTYNPVGVTVCMHIVNNIQVIMKGSELWNQHDYFVGRITDFR